MKKNNNIKQLKEIVNNDLFFDLHYQGVQAYNISSANEYEVITGFRKCNGRYYFIDRNRNKYLASRYDRADFIAGEMLEQKAREDETVAEAIEDIEKTGKTKILVDLAWEYIKACKARGINPGELVESEEDNAGNVYMIHCIESAKDEENGEDNESAVTCEPSMFAGILAKAETMTAKVKAFFAILAKMEWYSFIMFAPSLIMFAVVLHCIYLLASGACPDMGRAVEGIVLFAFLSFAFAFCGIVIASDEWSDAKRELNIA